DAHGLAHAGESVEEMRVDRGRVPGDADRDALLARDDVGLELQRAHLVENGAELRLRMVRLHQDQHETSKAFTSRRARRPAAAGPPLAAAATSALPTTTPSACGASARACAGSATPKPTMSGLPVRRRTCSNRSASPGASPARTPVTPSRLT